MADLKYGRLFTQADVQKILDHMSSDPDGNEITAGDVIEEMDEQGVRFKWDADEPVMALRARDNTALGTVRFYRDRQRRNAPPNHLDIADRCVQAFEQYRIDHPEMMKDPD
jgi:hypothetical protein